MVQYVAKYHIGTRRGTIHPGEVIEEGLSQEEAERLLKLGAIEEIGWKEEDSPRAEQEEKTEPNESAEAPAFQGEIDVMDGVAAKTGKKKSGGKRK